MAPAKRSRKKFEHFFMMGREMVLHSEKWKALSPAAVKVYLLLKAKYDGGNNGQIVLHYSEAMQHKGLASTASISRAVQELECGGWITRESCGGLMRTPSKYGFPGKHDRYFSNLGRYVPQKQSSRDQTPPVARGADDVESVVAHGAPDSGPNRLLPPGSAARYKESSKNDAEDRGLSAEPSGRTGAATPLGERVGLQKMTRDPSENDVGSRPPLECQAVRETPQSA